MNPSLAISSTASFTNVSLRIVISLLVIAPWTVQAKKPIRDEFFAIYSSAAGTVLDNALTNSSKSSHCGVCHYDFNNGGDPWNPYGWLVRSNIVNHSMSAHDAILAVASKDADGDGYDSLTEILDTTNYANTPTFPGLTPANVGNVGGGTPDDAALQAAIQGYLVPSAGGDTEPPQVAILHPNGGEVLVANTLTNIVWTAEDDGSGVAGFDLYLSLDSGTNFEAIALGLTSAGVTNTYAWFPANRPSSNALIKLVAFDNDFNTTNKVSAAVFEIASPEGGTVPTTLRDFDLPGTQPHELSVELVSPSGCVNCHGGYNTNHEPYFNWGGSMMAHASIDPLFLANLAIANQDAPDSGDLCLRCHLHAGWVQGRSVPTSGEAMLEEDKFGVTCSLCHRLVDPIYEEGVSPAVDESILNSMINPGTNFGIGMTHLDPSASRRGPFVDATNAPHSILVSSFHRDAALCGTCHDVSNPAFDRYPNGTYWPNALNAPATNFSSFVLGPVERTYSEWLFSDFNSLTGVELPQFAGNKTNGFVSTCQDCHMRDVEGYGCDTNEYPAVPLRADLPLHDLTGGSTWLPMILADLYPEQVDSNAVAAGVARATSLLQNAAKLAISDAGTQTEPELKVTVTNNCGHKLPTGYPEGRRIWLNVQFLDPTTNLISESGAYNTNTGELTHDLEAKIYEIHPGIDSNLVWLLGNTNISEGPSYHFVLNNAVFSDNRIPPRGFTNANFASFGGAPVDHTYADGQYWDDTLYSIPEGTKMAQVTLYYQSTSKEFVEFLRDENESNGQGNLMYDLWSTNDMCPPTLMQSTNWYNPFLLASLGYTNDMFRVDFHCRPGTEYTIEYADSLNPPVTWYEFQTNGTHTATNDMTHFIDDFTSDTSTNVPPANGMRFYRFKYGGGS